MMTSRKRLIEKSLTVVTMIAAVFTALLLVAIIGSIAWNGLPSLSLYFLTTPEINSPGAVQGILNAIVGTIMLSVLSVVIATPLALGTAIYLRKYSRENVFTRMLGFLLDVMSGTPSIVIGVFAFYFFAISMRAITNGFSLIAGSFALAILIMPVIERATEDALNRVPHTLEEGSLALGTTKWKTIRKITVPYALSGIVTGIVLAIGRAAEESAVVIWTAGYTQYMPKFDVIANDKLILGLQIQPLQDLVATLPIAVYHTYEFSNTVPQSAGFATALVLIVIVMLINAIARIILWKWKIE
jgi:phosphate ABC transporter, permease protein PstA